MKKYLIWAILSGGFLLPSCVSKRSFVNLVTRAYLFEGQYVSLGYGGYAYLLLQPPNPAPGQFSRDSQRLAIICEVYHQYLPNYQRYLSKKQDNKELMLIFYLIGGNGHFDMHHPCANVLHTYNFSYSITIMNSVPNYINAVHKGPFLIAWDRPYEERDQLGTHCLVIDMSDFQDEDLGRAMKIWIKYFAKDPDVWNEGLSYVLNKEEVRNFVLRYSGCITEFFRK